MTTSNQLSAAQSAMVERIYSFAREQGLSSDALSHELGMNGDTIEAIPDGIYSAERYLSAPKRILWVLKEPYDEITEAGMPCGGGWCIYECFDKDDVWRGRTWQPMIYASYGILHNLHYQDMDWIHDDPSMAEVLKDIAYINISKMPGFTSSNDADIQRYYDLWRPILLKQIELYHPDIIIFGNTFKYFKQDLLISDGAQPFQSLTTSNGSVYQNNYRIGDTILIDAYHPNQKVVTREKYVEGIIEACKLLKLFNFHDIIKSCTYNRRYIFGELDDEYIDDEVRDYIYDDDGNWVGAIGNIISNAIRNVMCQFYWDMLQTTLNELFGLTYDFDTYCKEIEGFGSDKPQWADIIEERCQEVVFEYQVLKILESCSLSQHINVDSIIESQLMVDLFLFKVKQAYDIDIEKWQIFTGITKEATLSEIVGLIGSKGSWGKDIFLPKEKLNAVVHSKWGDPAIKNIANIKTYL